MKPSSIKFQVLAMLFGLGLNACAPSVKEIAIEPPFEKVELPRQELTLDPSKEQVVKFESGVTVDVPADAFVDAKGNPVSGEVTLQLKTFETPAEIIASGIPMTFEDGDQTRDFESAGMFQIQGLANGQEIAIAEGKDLAVNYPSASVGEYDFFYFEESEDEGATKGYWQKLSEPKETEAEEPEGFGTFNLQFDDTSYTELAPLNEIDWKSATERHNPLNAENKWVLNEKWVVLEVSQPKFGFGEKVFEDSIRYWWNSDLLISPDSQSFLAIRRTGARLWSRTGKLLLEVKNLNEGYRQVEALGENHFCVSQEDGDYVYDFKGKLKGKIGKSFGRKISSDDSRIVCQKFGEPNVVWIYTIAGDLVKTLNLKKHDSEWGEPNVYEHFILSETNELIVNDANGVSFYDLDGNLLRNRPELCHNIHHMGEGQLLLERLDGHLAHFNYSQSMENTSTRAFQLHAREVNNVWHSAHVNQVKKTNWVVIEEPGESKSILWNYESDEVKTLEFKAFPYYTFEEAPHLIQGFNEEMSTYHLYDLNKQESIITLPDYQRPFQDFSLHGMVVSEDGQYLIQRTLNMCRLYSSQGNLIRDFSAFDSSIYNANFMGSHEIGTVNESGIYRKWNLKGEEISSTKLKGSDFVDGRVFDEFVATRDGSINIFRAYDFDGSLDMSDWSFPTRLGDDEVLLKRYGSKAFVLNKLFSLEKGVYQLSVKTKDKQFHTYVYLTQQQKEAIELYEQARLVRLNAEKDRQKVETRIVRRFAIKKFGIYNYDRFVNDKSRIHLAASFDFGQPIDFNNITVFLVTDFNGPSVVKFYKSTWDKFSFDPTKPNRLLAALPDNKVAYFSQADFDQLNIETIKQSKAYQFNMKVSDKPIAELMDLEKVL